MRSKAKMKLSLVASCALSLLAVTSASISTFAWFSASADVEIEASTSSTTITVTKPDDVDISATIHNCSLNGVGNYGYTSGTPTYSNFDWSNVATSAQKTFPAWPGYKKTYGIKVISTSDNSFNCDLFIDSFTSTTMSNRHRRSEGSESSDGVINFAKAVNVYFGFSTSATYNMNGTDKFQWTYDAPILKSSSLRGTIPSGTDVTSYFFYTIEFDDTDASRYVEYEDDDYDDVFSGDSIKTTSSEEDRYFAFVTSEGNSNCYDGLSFTINTLKLEVAS